MKTIKLKIKELQINKDGNLVVITEPHTSNPKGAYVMNEAQTSSICRRAGVPSIYGLKHVESLSNGTSFLEIQEDLVKVGDVFTKADGSTQTALGKRDKVTGELIGDGSWTKYSNHTIQLGFASKMKLAELSLQAAFANPLSSQPVKRVEVPVTAEDNSAPETTNV